MLKGKARCVIFLLAVSISPPVGAQSAVPSSSSTSAPDLKPETGPWAASISSLTAVDRFEPAEALDHSPVPNSLSASATSNPLDAPLVRSSSAIMAVPTPPQRINKPPRFSPFSKVAMGIQATSLGIGATVATPLARSLNLRFVANFFNLGYDFDLDGAFYNFDLHLRSEQLSVDWHPFHGNFHISPGVLIYNSDVIGTAIVPAGYVFQLGSTTLTSSSTDPIHGSATFLFGRKLMPSVMFGFGNIVPRSGKRLTFPFEIGAAYMGHNQVNLNLQGTACIQGTGCLSTSDPGIQQDVLEEQGDLNESIKRLQAYPIISSGIAYRF